jgi:hypothetical protein
MREKLCEDLGRVRKYLNANRNRIAGQFPSTALIKHTISMIMERGVGSARDRQGAGKRGGGTKLGRG